VAGCMPAAMLFVRSPDGVSHHPDESVREEDVALAKQTIEESRNSAVDDETAEISGEPGAKA